MKCRQSESVLAVDVAQAFTPVDASLSDIISGMLAQAATPKAADPDMLPPPDGDTTSIKATPASPSACGLPVAPKHFLGRDETVTSLVAFVTTAASASAGVMLHGGPGQVRDPRLQLRTAVWLYPYPAIACKAMSLRHGWCHCQAKVAIRKTVS